jgi:hypothetical protein
MSLRETFLHYFEHPEARPDRARKAEALAMARDLVQFTKGAYCPHLMAYLRDEASRPMTKIGTDRENLAHLVRAQVFSEIAVRLTRDIDNAKRLMKEAL